MNYIFEEKEVTMFFNKGDLGYLMYNGQGYTFGGYSDDPLNMNMNNLGIFIIIHS